jgi:hypothetical protein
MHNVISLFVQVLCFNTPIKLLPLYTTIIYIKVVKLSLDTPQLVVQVAEVLPDGSLSETTIIGQDMDETTAVGQNGPEFTKPWAFEEGPVLRLLACDFDHLHFASGAPAAAVTPDELTYLRLEYKLSESTVTAAS